MHNDQNLKNILLLIAALDRKSDKGIEVSIKITPNIYWQNFYSSAEHWSILVRHNLNENNTYIFFMLSISPIQAILAANKEANPESFSSIHGIYGELNGVGRVSMECFLESSLVPKYVKEVMLFHLDTFNSCATPNTKGMLGGSI